jgi:sugar/nucleoside kinase (ribokinase family)
MGTALKADPLARTLRLAPDAPFRRLVGVGGIGAGILFALEGNHDLGRNESRPGRLLDVRDYCKLHIVAQYPTVLLGAREDQGPFHVVPVGKVGIDEVGLRLRAEMERAGMDVRFVDAIPGRPTLLSVCFQFPDGSGGNVTTVDSAAALVSERDVDHVERWLTPTTIALAAAEVPLPVRRHLLRRATERGALRAASLTTTEVEEVRETGFLSLVDLLAVNEDEASALVGAPFPAGAPEPFLQRFSGALPGLRAGVRLVVTAGARGAFAFDGTSWTHVPALPVAVVSTAGAGDALFGGILTGLAAGLPFVPAGSLRASLAARPLSSALELGVLVAAFKVTSPHTIPPDLSLDALVAFARDHGVAFGEGLHRLVPAEHEHHHAS